MPGHHLFEKPSPFFSVIANPNTSHGTVQIPCPILHQRPWPSLLLWRWTVITHLPCGALMMLMWCLAVYPQASDFVKAAWICLVLSSLYPEHPAFGMPSINSRITNRRCLVMFLLLLFWVLKSFHAVSLFTYLSSVLKQFLRGPGVQLLQAQALGLGSLCSVVG